jgi:E3 ubiquitin-protein ligase CCNP1IP1
MRLSNPDDVVVTNLNPTEDYKTSVLSGLSPNVIMECAGRGLSFWAYQTTQEMSVRSTVDECSTEQPAVSIKNILPKVWQISKLT